MTDDRPESKRQIARREMRTAGYRSEVLANKLMKLHDSAVVALDLDDELRGAIERARKVTSMVARRRAERGLAGVLRTIDLRDLEIRLENVKLTGAAEPELFHIAEQWRAKPLADGLAAAGDYPGAADPELPRLIDAALREKATGKPPGASRALFRHITAALKGPKLAPTKLADVADDADDADDAAE